MAGKIQLVVNNDVGFEAKNSNNGCKLKKQQTRPEGEGLVRHSIHNLQRVDDSLALARMGLSLTAINELTNYPYTIAKQICASSGTKAQSGRRRTSLGDLIRNPLFHAAVSLYIANLETILKKSEGQLNARTFVTSVRQFMLVTSGTMVKLHCDLLYGLARSYIAGTTQLKFCTSCRSSYAHVSPESGLVRETVYECPCCREMAALIGGASIVGSGVQAKVPTNMGQLHLTKPLSRFNSMAPPAALVRGTLNLLVG